MIKKIVVLGGGGFIGGHLSRRLKNQGHHVTICDIKRHDYFSEEEICNQFIQGDLTRQEVVDSVIGQGVHEVYQLAADMGGAGYIFTGEHDANLMYNSAIINLHVAKLCASKKVEKVFYSSSACIYPEHNQTDPNSPNCEESSAYPASPDSEYGWEKIFSERMFSAFSRNLGVDVRIARFHNIFGTMGTWVGGREKSPAAICRKVAMIEDGGTIEVWGDGQQTRSYLFIDECLEAVDRFMKSDFSGPVNIGSEEMVTINELVRIVAAHANKKVEIDNLYGVRYFEKYGSKCPVGVKGRRSDNRLFFEKVGWQPSQPLSIGMAKTYDWVLKQINLTNG